MEQAPSFTLKDQFGTEHSLEAYRGQWVVLYFYPKDDTPGCTKEACQFRDSLADYAEHNAVILGISKDTVRSHAKFAEKFQIQFPLLSDPTTETIQAYGVWKLKKFMGREYMGTNRDTILINPEGMIVKRYESVDPVLHVAEVLDDIAAHQL